MKKIFYVIVCMAIVSLACLSTATVDGGPQTVKLATLTSLTNASATADDGPQTVFVDPEIESVCAIVIADEALHVREFPNVDADIKTWLKNNDVVHVLDSTHAEWWRVRFNEVEGFARSSFLAEVEC